MQVITWNTRKTGGFYVYRVYTVGYQVDSVTLKTGIRSTRARAVTQAKKWVRHFKAQQKVAA